MTRIRWVAYLSAVTCLVVLTAVPRSPVTAIVAGLFAGCFVVVAWSYGAFGRRARG